MKILAFSDWRVQPTDIVHDLVNKHQPDVILYAGDDLNRFINLDKGVLLKTQRHLLRLKYPNLEPLIGKEKRLLTPNFKKYIKEINLTKSDIVHKLDVPFYFVNGNDDRGFLLDCDYYVQLDNCSHLTFYNSKLARNFLAETPKGRITIRPLSFKEQENESKFKIIEDENNLSEHELNSFIENGGVAFLREGGIYSIVSPSQVTIPSFGEISVSNSKEDISLFGVECKYGMDNKIKNTPKKYADVFLSHIPPYGVLDLSARFGINHIGSKSLLKSVKKYQPKLVICGHSHIWGGFTRKIGDTLVINVSSNDRIPSRGIYSIIDTENWDVEIKTVEKKAIKKVRGLNTVKINTDKKIDEILGGIPGPAFGCGESYCVEGRCAVERERTVCEIKKIGLAKSFGDWKTRLNFLNVEKTTVKDDRIEILEKIESFGINVNTPKERIKSLYWKKPKIIKKITFNPYKQTFVDVETGLANGREPGKLWLIGILHDNDLHQFLYPKERNKFFAFLEEKQIKSLVSWTGYDKKSLQSVWKGDFTNIKFIDACIRTANCVVWHDYSLHGLYDALFTGEASKKDLIPGFVAGLYADHLIIQKKSCPYCHTKEEIIEQIKERNRIDLIQMFKVCRKLWEYS
jgi:Icc-related predicted phosphoesterase